MDDHAPGHAARGDLRVVQPEAAERLWQPVPANGHIAIRMDPTLARMANPFGFGTQVVPPGGHVREHAHERNEELIHVLSGQGRAVLDGEDHPLRPGTTIFLGCNRLHMFVNTGGEDLVFAWLILPNGLEDFFRAIGRPMVAGAADPTPFPRPADVLAIEARTVFAPPPHGGGRQP